MRLVLLQELCNKPVLINHHGEQLNLPLFSSFQYVDCLNNDARPNFFKNPIQLSLTPSSRCRATGSGQYAGLILSANPTILDVAASRAKITQKANGLNGAKPSLLQCDSRETTLKVQAGLTFQAISSQVPPSAGEIPLN